MIIGIDLGTTNSLVAVFRDGEAKLVPNVFGDYLTPSVVSVSDGGELLVGRAAEDRLVTHPQLTAAAFKRAMGSEKIFTLGRHRFRPEELSALILKSLIRDAEEFLEGEVKEAIISVPAYFNDMQRRATVAAGTIAGISVERLVNEPTAAALAYGLNDREGEGTFLVFDVGGGTFDVSILELFDGVMEVHASAGDNFLGGEDFVERLVQLFQQKTGAADLTAAEQAALRAAAERAKRGLNTEDVTMRIMRAGGPLECVVTRDEYAAAVEPLLQRLRAPVERALRDARLRVNDLDEIVLVGGSTRKALIQGLVARMFGRLPLRHINPDEVVAQGAAVQAALKMRDAALDDVVMTDVCPYTLGIEVADEDSDGRFLSGLFSPILERNTVVPASRVETYYPIREGQRTIDMKIYQGESRRVADNVLLGSLDIRLPRGLELQESGVDVRFTYDVNGILEVLATTQKTGEVRRLVITRDSGTMSAKQIADALQALAHLKIHPREQDENAAAMNRALRMYEEHLGHQRDRIGQVITQFEAVLARQDPREIREFRSELEAFLGQLEQDSVF